MVSMRSITGSRAQIVEEIQRLPGEICSVTVVLNEKSTAKFSPPSDAEVERLMKRLESLTVAVPHADDSCEAIYTRMPGE